VHDQGLCVIMDVVYNHVFDIEKSNFNAFVPGYYFRYNEDGTLTNGTGVGMDTASERRMMRKFIIDSVTYWANEYQIDGFRFDLMGIHDVETMNAVRDALDSIDPKIIILGEGWELNTPLNPLLKATKKNADQMPGIAFFNDEIRDGLKGNVFEAPHKGFINGGQGFEDTIKLGIAGKVAVTPYIEPNQVVTYTEAHDNYTIWDKLKNTNLYAPVSELIRMHKLASAIVLTSQGISFIHAGQEFMRTKNGDSNSYKSLDSVNQLDWRRRSQFNDEVNYMRGLIELRKEYPAFRMSQSTDIQKYLIFMDTPKNIVAYTLVDPRGKYELVIIHNANQQAFPVILPHKGEWQLLVNGEQAGIQTITTIYDDSVIVPAVCSFVLKCNQYNRVNNDLSDPSDLSIESNHTVDSDYSMEADLFIHHDKALENEDSEKLVMDSKKLVIDDQLYQMITTLTNEQKITLYMFLLSLRK
jgi:pullulanase